MYTVKATIQGVAPLLFNRPANERVATGTISDKDRRDTAIKEKVHRDENGDLFIPRWNLKQSLINGCKSKFKRQTQVINLVKAACFPGDSGFGRKDHDFIHECWGRVPPRTGALVTVWRPAMREGWTLPISLTITDHRLTADQVRLSLEEAGLMVGLGSWRPEYGRFVVSSFEASDAEVIPTVPVSKKKK